MLEVLDSVCQFKSKEGLEQGSMHLVPHLISSSRLLMSVSANSSFSFALLNDASLRKCFSLKSFKYLSSLHVSNAVTPFFTDFSHVLNLRQSSTDIISSYIDLKPSLCILKLSPFVRVLTRPNGTAHLRLTGTLPNLKQVKLDVVPNTFLQKSDLNDSRHFSDSKMGSVLEHSPGVKRSRRSSFENASLLSNEDSIKIEPRTPKSKKKGKAELKSPKIYSLRDNFKMREILRSLRFVFRKNKLLRECVFDRFQNVMGLGNHWVMMEHEPHSHSLQDVELRELGHATQDKHRAMYLKRKLELNSEVIKHLRKKLPRNLLYKYIIDRLRNKNNIVLYSKFFTQSLVVQSVWDFLFGARAKFQDLVFGLDQASFGGRLITELKNTEHFSLRYSPNVRFFISQSQLRNEAFPIVKAISETFQSQSKINQDFRDTVTFVALLTESGNVTDREHLNTIADNLVKKLGIFDKKNTLELFDQITEPTYVDSWNLSQRPWF
jgi:hypothetical protein